MEPTIRKSSKAETGFSKTLIKFYFNLNSFFGLFPFWIKKSSEGDKIEFRFNLILYATKTLIYSGSFLTCQYVVCYQRTVDLSLQELVFNCCSFYTTFVVLFVNMNNLRIRDELRDFILKHNSLSVEISKVYGVNVHDRFLDKFVWFETVFLTTFWTYMLAIYYYFYDFTSWMLFLVGFTLPKFLVILAGFTFLHFAVLLKVQFRTLNSLLLKEEAKNFDEKTLRMIPGTYFKLVGLTKKINKLHGFQNLAVLSKLYVWVVFEMYHFILLGAQSPIPWRDVKLMIFGFSWSTLQLGSAACLLIVCGYVKTEANKFGRLWGNRLIRKRVDGKISIAFKLAMDPVLFSTSDWFNMDFVLFLEMTGSISTFIVILTQFSTKFISNNY